MVLNLLWQLEFTLLGKYRQAPVKAFKNNNKVKIVIVANKLRTGFDEPTLSILYLDKKLDGVNVIQTLGRLSRTCEVPAKEPCKNNC
jgi:type I restriction enzyme R subunit